MIVFDKLLKPRRLPSWWLRFTEAHSAVPAIVAITGLAWICLSIAQIVTASHVHGHGQMIETIKVVPHTQPIIDHAINLRSLYHRLFPAEIRSLVFNLYGNIAIYLIVPFILFLEFLFPANPSQPLIGKGFLQDAIWYIIGGPIILLILYPVAAFLQGAFREYLGFLIIDSSTTWPAWLQIIAAMLLVEFLIWFNHFVRHKVRVLWLFHAVHHSQKELNVFTDDRAHIVDLIVESLTMFIPFFIFHVPNLYAVTLIGIYKPIHNRFIHANLKINLGWLGLVFTSPQFHRVHHSMEPEHIDKNFGLHFSLYDHLFGTACPNRNVYPQTGIDDARFPSEDKIKVSQLPKNWFLQVVYPFRQIYERVVVSPQFHSIRKSFHQYRGVQEEPKKDSTEHHGKSIDFASIREQMEYRRMEKYS